MEKRFVARDSFLVSDDLTRFANPASPRRSDIRQNREKPNLSPKPLSPEARNRHVGVAVRYQVCYRLAHRGA